MDAEKIILEQGDLPHIIEPSSSNDAWMREVRRLP